MSNDEYFKHVTRFTTSDSPNFTFFLPNIIFLLIVLFRTLNVRLNNNVETIKWLRNNTFNQLANLVKSSNPQVVADYAAGLITVLNQVISFSLFVKLPC